MKNRPLPRTNKLPPLGGTRVQRRTDRGGDEGKTCAGGEEHGGYREGVSAVERG